MKSVRKYVSRAASEQNQPNKFRKIQTAKKRVEKLCLAAKHDAEHNIWYEIFIIITKTCRVQKLHIFGGSILFRGVFHNLCFYKLTVNSDHRPSSSFFLCFRLWSVVFTYRLASIRRQYISE